MFCHDSRKCFSEVGAHTDIFPSRFLTEVWNPEACAELGPGRTSAMTHSLPGGAQRAMVCGARCLLKWRVNGSGTTKLR